MNSLSVVLRRNSINILSNTPQLALQIWCLSKVKTGWPFRWFWKVFSNVFAKSTRLIVLDIDWVQFVLKNCEILHSVRGPYDKYCSTVSPQRWCIKSIKDWFCTPPDLLARFCKVSLSNAKIRPDLFSKNMFSRPNLKLLWSRAIMALECDRRGLLFFKYTYNAINSM